MGLVVSYLSKLNWTSSSLDIVELLHPLVDKDQEELDKLLYEDDIISMHLLSIEFNSELLFAAACSIWLHSVTRLKYVVDPALFLH